MRHCRGLGDAQILLGDSLGEMFFYLAGAGVVVVGGGFVTSGAHNVIEPLALGKPVITGPEVWTIEFPAVEAGAAGVLTICENAGELVPAIRAAFDRDGAEGAVFHETYTGASARIYEAIRPCLEGER